MTFVGASTCISTLAVATALSCLLWALAYDETVWTRQWDDFQLPFPAQLVLTPHEHPGFGLSSQTGPYDPTLYSKDAKGDIARQGLHLHNCD